MGALQFSKGQGQMVLPFFLEALLMKSPSTKGSKNKPDAETSSA
jgi:hypothetical protein